MRVSRRARQQPVKSHFIVAASVWTVPASLNDSRGELWVGNLADREYRLRFVAMCLSWAIRAGKSSPQAVLDHEFNLLPRGFFDRNPFIDLPPSRRKPGGRR